MHKYCQNDHKLIKGTNAYRAIYPSQQTIMVEGFYLLLIILFVSHASATYSNTDRTIALKILIIFVHFQHIIECSLHFPKPQLLFPISTAISHEFPPSMGRVLHINWKLSKSSITFPFSVIPGVISVSFLIFFITI